MKPRPRRDAAKAGAAELAIVGGGAAGLFAAASAARLNVPCVVFERKARLGSKILMTANGRCNFAKDIDAQTVLADLVRGGVARACADFAGGAVRSCPPRQ
ncbi:MAG: NAD(P)/FAD-dependent oxidoreductase, partial [Kiritimatiellae bacterium]|nr:NAD(P)/FAD-dependent oxidoreductase [Kiritimatiellia bacterium]